MQGPEPGRGFRNRDEAQARLHEVLSEINKGDYVEPKIVTFAEFAEQWIDDRISIRGSTASAYGSIIRQNLVPHLGKLRVHEIRFNDVQSLVSKLATDLSVKSLHNVVTLLRVMLVGRKGPSAIKQGFLRHDPTKGVELPTKEHREIRLPTPEQVWMLIDTAQDRAAQSRRDQVAHAMILVDAFTGLRRGEILALRYTDIDWFSHEIVVRRAIAKIEAKDGVHKWAWELGPTKGRKTRRVGIGERVLRLLAELRQSAADKEGFVFTAETAGLSGSCPFIDPDYFDAEIYRPVVMAANLPDLRFHDIRHFFASMLIAQGESAKYVCDQMGHSSIQVTFDIYGHLFPQSRQEASSRLEQAMFEKRRERPVEDLVEKTTGRVGVKSDGSRAN